MESDHVAFRSGVLATVQDLGRAGYPADGIPRRGVRARLAVDPDEAHDLYVACRAVGGGAELA
jgi:hypothetical protein